MLSVSDAARELGLSAQMVRHLANTGKLRHMLAGSKGVRLFDPEDVKELKVNREMSKLFAEFFAPKAFTVRYPTAARKS